MLRSASLLLVIALFGGCVEESTQEFGGTFTREATQADIDDFRERMTKRGADDVLVMESFPMQFRVTGLGDDCNAASDEARSLPYVADVSPCRHTTKTDNGDEPTSVTQSV